MHSEWAEPAPPPPVAIIEENDTSESVGISGISTMALVQQNVFVDRVR